MAGARPVVTVTRRLPERVEASLREKFEARLRDPDTAMSPAELGAAIRTADAVLCTVTDRIPAEMLDVADRRARILANFGVGVNHIDLAAAGAAGVVVTNTPGVLTDDTADVAIALMLMVARRLGEGERELRAGGWTGWRPTHLLGTRLRGKTLGIVGFGRIGQAVARRAHHGLGMRVICYSRSPVSAAVRAEAEAEPRESVEALLRDSDVVSLHVPASPETRHLIDAGRLRAMRGTAFLINTARGDVVDESALGRALRDGVIAGAGIDVYEREPAVHPDLVSAPNTVLLPHLGSATVETRIAMGERAIANLDAFFRGEPPPDLVG